VKYRAAFFDAGETLLHPHPSFPELFVQVMATEGHPIDMDELREKLHLLSDRFAEAARANDLWSTSPERSRQFWRGIYEVLLAELGLPATDELAERLYREFTDLANYRLFEDVLPVLEKLTAAGLVLGVISNFEEWLERLLEGLEVSHFFDVRVISGVEGMEKPDPRIFRLALDRTGVAPEEAVYVGDNPLFDIEPARAVGMQPVLLDRRNRFPDAPRPRITSLDELPAVLGL